MEATLEDLARELIERRNALDCCIIKCDKLSKESTAATNERIAAERAFKKAKEAFDRVILTDAR